MARARRTRRDRTEENWDGSTIREGVFPERWQPGARADWRRTVQRERQGGRRVRSRFERAAPRRGGDQRKKNGASRGGRYHFRDRLERTNRPLAFFRPQPIRRV